ncbi:MAG: hypothetical protein RL722_1575 [Pseudomonadota bacterium]|jgi:hypothetical protein
MRDVMEQAPPDYSPLELHWADSELARLSLEADTLRLHFAVMAARRPVARQGWLEGHIAGHVTGLVLELLGLDLAAADSSLDTGALGRISHGRLLRDGQVLPPAAPGQQWQGALRLELEVALHGSLLVRAGSAWLDASRMGPFREHLSC